VFESETYPGGLAVGFKEDKWKWSLERHYHHWFESDWSVRNLAKEVGHEVLFIRPKTSTFIGGETYQLDSPMSLLTFPKIKFSDRLRTGVVLALLKLTNRWKPLEKVTSENFLRRYMGESSWEVIWKPLFEGKFQDYYTSIPASWFWARIKKRSASLGYPVGGFLSFAKSLEKNIRKLGGKIYYKKKVESISEKEGKILLKVSGKIYSFDKVICTLPSHPFVKITKGLQQDYIDGLLDMKSIGAVNLVLSLKNKFLEDGTYWLNINQSKFPFLAVVEHTNFMDKKFYNNEHLLYIGNYLPHEHGYFVKTEIELLKEFYPYLKTINPKFTEDWINRAFIFKAPFAQPIIPLNYSRVLPPFETPIKNLYLCNIQQVYPWDRGTNYAVENGEAVARLVLGE